MVCTRVDSDSLQLMEYQKKDGDVQRLAHLLGMILYSQSNNLTGLKD